MAPADEGLEYGGPHMLSDGSKVKDGKKLRDHLRETGRVHPVVDALKLWGVEYFWWLGPKEPAGDEDGAAWEFGAFVYLYRDGDEDKDCFLAVDPERRRLSLDLGQAVGGDL